MFNETLFKSDRHDWATPQALVDGLAYIFGRFTLDVCATPETAKAPRYFTPDDDGLSHEWCGTCWMNPPYGREISGWVRKAWESGKEGATVVCLLPARTDTDWWTRYVTKAETVLFMKGRIKFDGAEHGAPFPSAIVVFR